MIQVQQLMLLLLHRTQVMLGKRILWRKASDLRLKTFNDRVHLILWSMIHFKKKKINLCFIAYSNLPGIYFQAMNLTWHFSARLTNCSVPGIFFFQLYLDILVKSTLNLLCERLIRLGCVSLSLEGMVGFVVFFFYSSQIIWISIWLDISGDLC